MLIDHRRDSSTPCIRIAGHNRGDPSSTSRFASGYEDQQLHKKVVHVRSTGSLQNEYVFITDGLVDPHRGFAIRELADRTRSRGNTHASQVNLTQRVKVRHFVVRRGFGAGF